MDILTGLKDSHKSMSFSLNGKWGCGKTFVLDLLAKRILASNNANTRDGSSFCYIRYDCWKYDYYREPLVAFVSAVQDAVEVNTSEGNANYVGEQLRNSAKDLGKWVAELGCGFIKAQCGVDISKILFKIIDENPEKTHKSYDENFSITKAINGLRDIIKKISSTTTLVIVVDELDRCLPEYMLRVLERLHHLFEGLDNVILIVATDKTQIEYTIRHIYGERTDARAYLQKMINFELNLDCGKINDEVVLREKFSYYCGLFKDDMFPSNLNISEFFDVTFRGIEVRKIIRWIDKISLIHCMSFGSKKIGYDIFYYELFWTILTKEYNIVPATGIVRIDKRNPFNMFYQTNTSNPNRELQDIPLISYLTKRFKEIDTDINLDQRDEMQRFVTLYSYADDLTMMFWYWTKMMPQISQVYYLPKTASPQKTEELKKYALDNCECLKKYQDLMKIIN